MANNKRLTVTDLDFDDVKSNLKNFLKAQTEFKDYDFEGSGMNILLDTLAYNTHYLGFNANMLANEMFLDTAALRSSVVSHAKTLGYEVSSCRAPIATINVSLSTTSATKTMSAGTAFTSTVDDVSYQFVAISDVTSTNVGNAVNFDSINIYEGTYVTTKFIVDTSDIDQRFIVADNRVDTSTLTVKVQTSATDTSTTTYTKATDISQLSATSTAYFLQEVERGRFEVYFGDGTVSKALSDGNVVVLQYVVTNKTLSNGASSFSAPSSIDGVSTITVTTVANASGGSEAESIQSIKLNAPLDYAAQGRCVTTDDFKLYAKKLFANAKAVSVWGGEDGSYDTSLGVTSTAEYGKVFISIKTTTGEELTTNQKSQLVNDFGKYKVASVTPVIVDPEITYIILGVTFNYDSNSTTKTGTELAADISTTLTNYNSSDLESFNNPFRHSKLTGLVDETHSSILNNTTTVTIGKFFTPTLSETTSYNVNFNNAFYNPHSGHNSTAGGVIASTGFKIDGGTTEYFFDDDGDGNLRIYYLVGTTRTYYDSAAGTITYSTGYVAINSIKITSVSDVDGATSTKIRITAIPNSNDIIPVRNQLLELDLTNSTVTATVDKTATTGAGYTVTSTGTSTTTSVSTTKSTPPTSAY